MNAKKRKTISILGIIAGIFVALILWTLWGNTALQLNSYAVASRRLPDSFDGYRIAQVSDLHNAELGEDNKKLLNMLREAQPDMIAITGDLIDSYDTDLEIALKIGFPSPLLAMTVPSLPEIAISLVMFISETSL